MPESVRYFKTFCVVCVLAAASHFLVAKPQPVASDAAAAVWPDQINGKELTRLPLTENEKLFTNSFPGDVARFTDGQKQFIIRQITRPTRKLHPAWHCYRASGYQIKHLPVSVDQAGTAWATFKATKADETLMVRERIYDNKKNYWLDTSSWFWAATLTETTGPWRAVTVIENIKSKK